MTDRRSHKTSPGANTIANVGREAVDRAVGKLKEAAGAVFDDKALREEGQLQQRRADAERRARAEEWRAEKQQQQASAHVSRAERASERVARIAAERSAADHEDVIGQLARDTAEVDAAAFDAAAAAGAREEILNESVDGAQARAAAARRREHRDADGLDEAALAARRRAAGIPPQGGTD